MSKLFFHERLKKLAPLIRDGDLEEAERELSQHIGDTAKDMSEDEAAFSELVKYGHAYIEALQQARQIIRKVREQQSENSTEAIELVNQAVEHGKNIVIYADKVRDLTKKEELDSL